MCLIRQCRLVVLAVRPPPPHLSGAYFRVAATALLTSDSVLLFTDLITLAEREYAYTKLYYMISSDIMKCDRYPGSF